MIMAKQTTGNAYKNKNSYNQMGVVVFKIEEVEDPITKQTKLYATGFDFKNPGQLVSVALMEEEGYRKFFGQMTNVRLYEKQSADGKATYFKNNVELPSKEAYDKELYSNSIINEKISHFKNQRKNAETLATKKDRASELPVVMMFDGANHLGSVGGVKVYEAKWISGTDPVSHTHRKILGNIHIKHDQSGVPYWGEVNAVDRINKVQIPTPSMTPEKQNEVATYNRDLLVHALSNRRTTEEGYSSERKPYVSFKLEENSTGKVANVRIYPEEERDSRAKKNDSMVEFQFQRPKAAHETLEAYASKQDTFSSGLNEILTKGQKITDKDYDVVNKAYKSDQVRVLISGMLGIPFQPLVTPDLVNSTDVYDLKVDISKKANQLKSLHKKLVLGEITPTIVSGTTYDVGIKYLSRLVNDLSHRSSSGEPKPLGNVVELIPNSRKISERDRPHIISGANKDNDLIFSNLYISLREHDNKNENTSLFASLLTTPHQSPAEALKGRVLFSQLTEAHSPTVDSFRFLEVEYKDYIKGEKEVPSLSELINEKSERLSQLTEVSDLKQGYDDLYRILGKHTAPEIKNNDGKSSTSNYQHKKPIENNKAESFDL